MPEENTDSGVPARDGVEYRYPADLARLVRDRWTGPSAGPGGAALPDAATLEQFFSACYQASLLREEERAVTFRAILAAPSLFTPDGRPPESLQPLEFARSLPFDAASLRQLSVAADARRTLIGVCCDDIGALRIWGLISSGTRWLRDVQGGRRAAAPLPLVPTVHVSAPGSMAVHKGSSLVATLQHGRLSGSRADPFVSKWLPDQFGGFRDELMARHNVAANQARLAGERWASLEPTLPRRIAERMMKRVIAMLRDARHGGTIIFLPTKQAIDVAGVNPYLNIKYRFTGGVAQRSFPDIVVDILNRLAQVYRSTEQDARVVGWREFEAATDDKLAILDETLFETAHLIAGLAAADGAVVMSKENELIGFGAMIVGRLPGVASIGRALDLEGEAVTEEDTGAVGARHRSAYRLAAALSEAVVIVISQDGGVRFVSQRRGRVTYWELD